ncbi:OmpH family outer membrane protein|uniref:Periplasmic chaperone for outer membrane proteins Skp n=1 Tax=Dendrosporobacter quercicolus TaxID=146817 RepID=A0A1G9R505_9FIRM|nr:OmpH family outer membrane protein [Dendrosporobacter quercicolus]NSL48479.1 OmpH family outer membrane protein [Dendrosporobacter quercicolus DSM 1736]SDM18200.1 periplasmic chaperone for outer membrane proteins Skp [Dendrosporobacter quercicolus]
MKLSKKQILLFLVAFVAVIFISGCSSNTQNVGVLDVNKVMSDSPKIKQFQDQLNTKGKELSDQLEKDKASLSAEEFQKRQETAYGEFLKTKQELEGQIDSSIKQVLDQVAQEKKMGVILYKNGVAQGGTDITDEVIQKLQ